MSRLVAVATSVCLLMAGLFVPAAASTIEVDCAAGDDLQAAVDGASDGDTIVIRGRCEGGARLEFIEPSNLTIRGASRNAVIAPGISMAGVSLTLERVAVNGFISSEEGSLTLDRVRVFGHQGGSWSYSGIRLYRNTTVIEDSAITGHHATLGGAPIWVAYGTLTMRNSIVRDNEAERLGGGISIGGAQVTIEDSRIIRNEAGMVGGGIFVAGGDRPATLVLRDSRVIGNTAGVAGGGIYVGIDPELPGVTFEMEGSTVKNNTPDDCFGC